MNNNLKEISSFIKKNNSYSDFNFVNGFLYNLNFTKIKFKNSMIGGLYGATDGDADGAADGAADGPGAGAGVDNGFGEELVLYDPNQYDPNQYDLNQSETQIQNILNIQKLPDMYLQNPQYPTDQENTYTIREGTILYHATTNKKGFNTNQLNLGKDKLINFFTPNFRLASDKIEGCSIDKQNGFIHVFRVIKDIPNIYIKLPYDIADDINSGLLAYEFCSGNQNYYGIGFFYPKNNIEMFSNNPYQQTQPLQSQILNNQDQYYSEFGLCNPKPYLQYVYSQNCQSLRKLSDPYRFD